MPSPDTPTQELVLRHSNGILATQTEPQPVPVSPDQGQIYSQYLPADPSQDPETFDFPRGWSQHTS